MNKIYWGIIFVEYALDLGRNGKGNQLGNKKVRDVTQTKSVWIYIRPKLLNVAHMKQV